MISENIPPIQGGIENHVHNLSIELAKKCNLFLISFYLPNGCKKVEKEGNLTIYRLLKGDRFSFIGHLLATIKIAKENQIDVIHVHTVGEANTIGAIAGTILRKPIVVTVHESSFIMNLCSKRLHTIRSITYRLRLRPAKEIITPSAELMYYVKHVVGNKKEVREIPNGVNLSLFHSDISGAIVKNKLNSGSSKIVLCPRRIAPKNGVIYLIKAIPRIVESRQDVRFVFVGPVRDYDYFKSIQDFVKKSKIEPYVVFTGGIPYNQMPAFYAASDVVVLPSLIEAISLAALEAMACGKPVVATSVGGLPEIIKNNHNGVLVEPANSKALAEAISAIICDEQLISKYVRNSLLTAKEFSWSNVAEQTLNSYFEVTKKLSN